MIIFLLVVPGTRRSCDSWIQHVLENLPVLRTSDLYLLAAPCLSLHGLGAVRDSNRKRHARCLAARTEGKESAQLSREGFEKFAFHPALECLKQTSLPCAAQPPEYGVVFPMFGLTWLGAVLFLGVQLRALWPVTALEVYTSREVDAVNGTNLRLKCTFSSSSPISPQLSVTWNFQPEDLSSHEPVFYYLKEPYKLSAGRFKGRATWDGNIERYDVSIVIWNLQPTDNGTFTCQVKNPPDVDGTIGEVRLRVVQKVHFSEIHFLAIAIGSACALMIIVVTIVIICRHHRKKQQEKTTEVSDTELREKEKLKIREEKEATPLED